MATAPPGQYPPNSREPATGRQRPLDLASHGNGKREPEKARKTVTIVDDKNESNRGTETADDDQIIGRLT